MTYIYLRVSTENQILENQKYEIERFCKERNIKIDKYIEEKKSGTITYKDRTLGKLIKKLKKNDILICSEISRLGRSMFMIMEILNILVKKEVKFYTCKEKFVMDNSISSKVISFAFSLSAEIERNLISQRTKEALELRKARGIKLGRPFGSKNKKYKLDKYSNIIKEGIEKKESWYKIAKNCNNANVNSVKNWCRYNLLFR